MGKPIRIVVVDDHVFYREGLKSFLGADEDLLVVGEAEDGPTALQVVGTTTPDVLLLDLSMRSMGGPEICARALEAHPELRVIMLTASDAREDLFAAVRAGAVGYLLKEGPPEELADAVRRVAAGDSLIHPRIAGSLLAEFAALSRPTPTDPWSALTGREIEVLRLVSAGMRNKEIGEQLFISEFTVKNHVRSILEKLELSSRVEAAAWAMRTGLVPIAQGEDSGR